MATPYSVLILTSNVLPMFVKSLILSKINSKTLLIIGTGALVSYMINAHCSVRPIDNILIWGRNISKVKNIVKIYKK